VAVQRTGIQLQQSRVCMFCCRRIRTGQTLRSFCQEVKTPLRGIDFWEIFSYSILKGSDNGVQHSWLLRFQALPSVLYSKEQKVSESEFVSVLR
jgi:hypothetical protein